MRRITLTLVVALLTALAAVSLVRAHGIGLPRAINVESGPYLLSVWTDPDPLRTDETHVVVGVMDPETRAPLLEDVTVSVRLETPGVPDNAVVGVSETDNTANQLLYAVIFNDVPSSGQWQATVIVEGARGTADDVTFPLEILPPQRFNWVTIGLASLAVVALMWLMLAMLQSSAYVTRESAAARRKVMSGR